MKKRKGLKTKNKEWVQVMITKASLVLFGLIQQKIGVDFNKKEEEIDNSVIDQVRIDFIIWLSKEVNQPISKNKATLSTILFMLDREGIQALPMKDDEYFLSTVMGFHPDRPDLLRFFFMPKDQFENLLKEIEIIEPSLNNRDLQTKSKILLYTLKVGIEKKRFIYKLLLRRQDKRGDIVRSLKTQYEIRKEVLNNVIRERYEVVRSFYKNNKDSLRVYQQALVKRLSVGKIKNKEIIGFLISSSTENNNHQDGITSAYYRAMKIHTISPEDIAHRLREILPNITDLEVKKLTKEISPI